MMKKRILRSVFFLLCCTALLLPCVSVALAADAVFSDDFESYASDAELSAVWEKRGTTTTLPTLSTERAVTGQSMLLNDTDSTSLQARATIANSTAPGTEFILTTQYYVETLSGTGSYANPYIRLTSSSTDVYTYSTKTWDRLSTIYTTQKANESLSVLMVSNTATVSKVYYDDVTVSVLTEALALEYIDEKLAIDGTPDLAPVLTSKALALTGVDETVLDEYAAALVTARAGSSGALTKAQVQACITQVNNADQNLVKQMAAEVTTSQTLSAPGVIALPEVSSSEVALEWTAVTGDANSRIRLTGIGALLDSQPDCGGAAETVTMTLIITKNSAVATVDVATTIEPYTQNMADLAAAAAALDISSYLNGQEINYVTADLVSLPRTQNGVFVSWQALDPATLNASGAMTASGAVTRPAYDEFDAAVLLRATLSKGSDTCTRDFYLIVASQGADDARTVVAKNAGFELAAPDDESTAPTGWNKRLKWADGKNEVLTTYTSVDTAFAYSGEHSLRITADGKMASVQNEHVTTAREGHVYSLQVMVCTNRETAAPSISLKFWDNEGVLISTSTQTAAYSSANSPSRGVWKNLAVQTRAPVGAVMVTAELDGGTAPGATWFDDVRLRESPLVANGSFDWGTAGWSISSGTVSGGKLTLPNGATATSEGRGANRGVAFFLTVEAKGSGTAALRFFKSGTELGLYTMTLANGTNTLYGYAPGGTTGMQVKLTGGSGGLTVEDVKIIRAPSGTGVADGGFEHSVKGVGTPWDLTDAAIAASTGKSGAGLTVSGSGTARSNVIPVIDGKSYTFTADVKGAAGLMTIELYTAKGLLNSYKIQSAGAAWNTITYTFDQLPEGVASGVIEHAYARVALSGNGAVFDNVAVYSLTDSVSNPSMENINNAQYGSFPYNWSSYGPAAAYVANQEGQATEGVKGLGVELFGMGEGGVRSAMVRAEAGKAYEAAVNAKGSGMSLNIEFWDESFAKLSSQSAAIDSTHWKEYSATATAPEGAAYVSLSMGGSGTGLAYVDQASIVPVVRTIGTNVQLFLDDWLIRASSNVRRTFQPGEKLERMISGGWYGNVVWNPEEQVYEMWYQAGKPVSYSLYYTTSTDGVNWSAGTQCISYSGTEKIQSLAGPTVFRDEDESDPDKRYKLVCYRYGDTGYDLHTSPDGTNWTRYGQILPGGDVITVAYDPVNDEYVATYKMSVGGKRTHSTAVSKDLIHWTEGVRMYSVATPLDAVSEGYLRADGYGTSMYPLGDSYVAFNWRFLMDDADGYGGHMDVPLFFSRDLTEDWQRLYDENGDLVIAIPRGVEGSWDDAQTYAHSYPIQMGDETWWYYHGWDGDHGTVGVSKTAGISAVKWRRNGFASLDFGTNGTMTTEQFILEGERLWLNAKGELTVELLDESGTVVADAGFSGDSVDKALDWSTSVDAYLGQTVSLRFTGSNAQLYSLQMRGELETGGYIIDMKSSLALTGLVTLPEDGGDYTYTVTHKGKSTGKQDFTAGTGNYVGLWLMSFDGIAAKEMRDTITFTVYKGSAPAYVMETSVYDAAAAMYAEKEDTVYRTMLADMLSYGAAAQREFEYNTQLLDTMPGLEGGSEAVGAWTATSGAGVTTGYESKVAATLSLKDKIELNIYVDDAAAEVSEVTFLPEGSTAGRRLSESDYQVEQTTDTKKNTITRVKFGHINVKDVRGAVSFTVKLSDTNETFHVKYSVKDYVRSALKGTAQADLLRALQKYVDSTVNYFTLHLGLVTRDMDELRPYCTDTAAKAE